jgi:hypothetical protein
MSGFCVATLCITEWFKVMCVIIKKKYTECGEEMKRKKEKNELNW